MRIDDSQLIIMLCLAFKTEPSSQFGQLISFSTAMSMFVIIQLYLLSMV